MESSSISHTVFSSPVVLQGMARNWRMVEEATSEQSRQISAAIAVNNLMESPPGEWTSETTRFVNRIAGNNHNDIRIKRRAIEALLNHASGLEAADADRGVKAFLNGLNLLDDNFYIPDEGDRLQQKALHGLADHLADTSENLGRWDELGIAIDAAHPGPAQYDARAALVARMARRPDLKKPFRADFISPGP